MTNEELVELIQAGERDRLQELWEQVERFVASRAQRLLTLSPGLGGVEFDDLYNSGYLALVAAVDTYDPEGGKSFIGWLALALKTAFAEAGGYRSERQKRDPIHCAGSLDAPLGDDEDSGTIADFIEDPGAAQDLQSVEERFWQEQLHAAIERALERLPGDERDAIQAKYYRPKKTSVSSRLAAKALTNLRRPALSRELRQFIEMRTPYYLHVGVTAFHNTQESAVERIVIKRERLEMSLK